MIDQILADLDRAIQLEPENAEYHYIRYSVLIDRGQTEAALADLDRAIELDPSTAQYYFARSAIRQFDDQAGASRDRQRAVELGYEEPGFPGMPISLENLTRKSDWDKFLNDPPAPQRIKEKWRLKCLE